MTALEIIPHIPVGEAVRTAVAWISRTFEDPLDWISMSGSWLYSLVADILLTLPPLAMVFLFALLAWAARSWQLAVGVLLTFGFIISMGQWVPAMQTLALVLLATCTSLALAIPLGILAAKSKTVSALIRPVLDLMQTLPAFVYLIPAITFFSIGVIPGLFATIFFSLPPGVRFTELGIREVDRETVEAGESFGATEWEILKGIELPQAVPTIMGGVNQVIMLALSMGVISGMVGADGLGKQVTTALASVNVGLGAEAGLSIVMLAIFLDRLTAALGRPDQHPTSLRAVWRKRASQLAPATRKTVSIGVAAALVLGLGGLVGNALLPRLRGGGSSDTVKVAYIPGWASNEIMGAIIVRKMEEFGYEVEMQSLSDIGPIYTALAQGDLDMFSSAWPERLQKSVVDQFPGQLESLGVFYSKGGNFLAVPEYSTITSIEELPQHADELGGKVYAIEPGAGLTITTEKVFEEYGLGTDFDLVTSSTQALTAQVKANVDSGEHFVATMWQPYWATSAFGMKRLEDPKNVYGGDEGVHVMARAGAAEDYPEFTEWLEGFELTPEEYASLETLITIDYEDGQEQEALDEWLESHPGRLD